MTYCFSLWWQLKIMTFTILLTYDLSTKHNLHSQHYYIYVQQQISDASMYTQARDNQIVTQMSYKFAQDFYKILKHLQYLQK